MASHEIFTKQSDGSVSKKIFTAPVGSVIAYPVDSVPDHCMECNGAVVSRAAYPELFAVLGTVYGDGDGSSTFKLPDFRDRFLRGADGTNGAVIGAAQGDAIRNITGYIHNVATLDGNASGCVTSSRSEMIYGIPGGTDHRRATYVINASDAVPTAVENRPVNYAVKYCIIYE